MGGSTKCLPGTAVIADSDEGADAKRVGLHTPASVHHGTAGEVRAQRDATLDCAYTANPARFRTAGPGRCGCPPPPGSCKANLGGRTAGGSGWLVLPGWLRGRRDNSGSEGATRRASFG